MPMDPSKGRIDGSGNQGNPGGGGSGSGSSDPDEDKSNDKPAGQGSGGVYESDQYGNLVKVGEGSGSSIGEGTGVSSSGKSSITPKPSASTQKTIEAQSRAKLSQTSQLKAEKLRIASKEVGPVQRVTTNPATGEVTYRGTKGSYTFPKEGTKFSGRSKFGGIASKEQPYNPKSPPVYVTEDNVARPYTEKRFEAKLQNERAESLKSLGGKVGYNVDVQGSQVTFREKDPTVYEVRQFGTSRKGEPIMLPVPSSKRKYSELSPAEKKAYNTQILNTQIGSRDVYGQYKLRKISEKISSQDVRVGNSYDLVYGNRKSTLPYFRNIGRSSSIGNDLSDSNLPKSEATFEKRILAFQKAEHSYYNKATDITGSISSYATFGFGKKSEERGFLGKEAQTWVQTLLNIPVGLSGLVLFTPKKAQFVGEGLGYESTRKSTLEELNPFPNLKINLPSIKKDLEGNWMLTSKSFQLSKGTGAGERAINSTADMLNLETSEGRAGAALILGGSYLKARTEFRAGKVGPFEGKTTVNIKTTTYKPPTVESFKVGNVRKSGNIETFNFEPIVDYTLQGKRVAPESYAKILQSEGKISVYLDKYINAEVIPTNYGAVKISRAAGTFEPGSNIINIAQINKVFKYRSQGRGRPYAYDANFYTPSQKRVTLAHELIHYKTRHFDIPGETNLPYRLQPQEMMAWGFEKQMARKGFAVSPEQISRYRASNSFDIQVREDAPLRFDYQRLQLLEQAKGRNAPAVSISEGIIKKGGMSYDYRSVQVGRSVSGTMRNKYMDIYFKKTPQGDMLVKQLRKDNIQPRWIREFKEDASSRLPAGLNLNEPNLVLKQYKLPYLAERPKFTRENLINIREDQRAGFDIGQKDGENIVYSTRNIARQANYRIAAKQSDFIQGKDISKQLYGKASTRAIQTDKAGYQKEVFQQGDSLSISLRPTDIEYVLQPSYKPNLKRYGMSFDNKPTSFSLERPPLLTRRTSKFSSETVYSYSESGFKPIKLLRESFKDFQKDFYTQLYKGDSSVIIDPFKLALKKETIGKSVKLEVGKPTLDIIPKSGDIAYPNLNTFQRRSSIGLPMNIYAQSSHNELRNVNMNRTYSYSRNNLKIFNFNELDIFAQNKSENLFENKSLSRTTTKQNTLTKQLTKQLTQTPIEDGYTHKYNFLDIPEPPPPIPFPPPYRSKGKRKKSRAKDPMERFFQYQPSLVGNIFNIERQPRRLLTGLEIRGV